MRATRRRTPPDSPAPPNPEDSPSLERVMPRVPNAPLHGPPWPENVPVCGQIRMIYAYPLVPALEVIEELLEEASRPPEAFQS